MKSVVRIVTRYGGDIQFEADEGSFAVNIVFIFPDPLDIHFPGITL